MSYVGVENCLQNLVGEPERKRPNGKYEHKIKVVLKGIVPEGVHQVYVAQDRAR
jgi:hypothetical protein